MSRSRLGPVVILLLGQAVAAADIEVEAERKNPWTRLEVTAEVEEDALRFAIVADRTGGHRPGVFAGAIEALDRLDPEIVLSVGDLVEGWDQERRRWADRSLLQRRWEQIEAILEPLRAPFFLVPGNNDLPTDEALRVWKSRFDRTYYSFRYRDVLFVILDSEDPPGDPDGRMGRRQLQWLERILAETPEPRWTFVLLHKPLWFSAGKGDWPAIAALLGERPHTVFAGHVHRYSEWAQGAHRYYVLGTTGGTWGADPPPSAFDHVMWISLGPVGPPKIEVVRLEELLRRADADDRARASGGDR